MFQRVQNRSLVAGLLSSVVVFSRTVALAQENPGQGLFPPRTANTVPAQNQSTIPQTRPGEAVQPRKPVDPHLMSILNAWETHTGKIKRMEGDFLRYEYDKVFRVERRNIGKYYYEAPDQGRMDFATDKKLPNPPVHVVDGVEMQVVSGPQESWICNGVDLFSIQIDQKTYHQVDIPPQFRGEAIKDGPLPFLFGMKAQDAIAKYDLEIGQMHNLQKDAPNRVIHLVAYPLMPVQQREFRKAELLINPDDFQPIAVKLFDTSGNKETTYKFTKHEEKSVPWFKPMFKVNLAAFQKINGDEKVPPQRESNRSNDPNSPVIR